MTFINTIKVFQDFVLRKKYLYIDFFLFPRNFLDCCCNRNESKFAVFMVWTLNIAYLKTDGANLLILFSFKTSCFDRDTRVIVSEPVEYERFSSIRR